MIIFIRALFDYASLFDKGRQGVLFGLFLHFGFPAQGGSRGDRSTSWIRFGLFLHFGLARPVISAAFRLLAHKVLSCLGQSRFLCLTGQPPGWTTTSTAHVILHDRHFASAVSADCLCRHSPLHLLSDFDPLVAGA